VSISIIIDSAAYKLVITSTPSSPRKDARRCEEADVVAAM
jgi:hypothetical protein